MSRLRQRQRIPAESTLRAEALSVPGRLNITWADDNTLKVDMDAGTQTRLFRFNATVPPSTPKSLQGYSVATWEVGARGGGGEAAVAVAAAGCRAWGSLRVVTTNLDGGYLLSSRNTYSDTAVLTEHFTRHSDFGEDYFTVTAVIEDGGGGSRGASSTQFNLQEGAQQFQVRPNRLRNRP